jgi:hypothetical protein
MSVYGHPSDNELLAILVDGRGFSEKAYRHVEACPLCSETLKNMEAGFLRMGDVAKKLAPEPSGKPQILPESPRAIRWKPAFVTVMALALVVWGAFRMSTPKALPESKVETAMVGPSWEDDRFMDEITDLSENALPEEFMNLLSEPDLEDDHENTGSGKPDPNARSFLKSDAMKGKFRC